MQFICFYLKARNPGIGGKGSPDSQLPKMIPDISVKPVIFQVSHFPISLKLAKKSNYSSIGREKVPGLTLRKVK